MPLASVYCRDTMSDLLVKDFDYHLPPELIAQTPLEDRSASRLMVVDRDHGYVDDTLFANIGAWLREGDLLVVNDSRVIPARLLGHKASGGLVEYLLLEQTSTHTWRALVRPGRRLHIGAEVEFGNGLLRSHIVQRLPGGEREVEFHWDGDIPFLTLLDQLGKMPLPPYIHEPLADSERYQTVYSHKVGSAAAPTAGLHFTDSLLAQLAQQGILRASVTLHIGLGTFRPVKAEYVRDHAMHTEAFSLDEHAAEAINNAKREHRRVIAVGTTSCRVLESIADENGFVRPTHANTDIFITPGYAFRCLDGLITNFHLPQSTLLMLVSALAGHSNMLACYQRAVDSHYRFFSFGDAMFIANHKGK